MWKFLVFFLILIMLYLSSLFHRNSLTYLYVANEYFKIIKVTEFDDKKVNLDIIDKFYNMAIDLEEDNYLFIQSYVNFLYEYKLYDRAVRFLEKSLQFSFKDYQYIDIYNWLSWLYSRSSSFGDNSKKSLFYAKKLNQMLTSRFDYYSSDQVALYLDTIAEAYFINKLYISAKEFGLQALRIVRNPVYRKDILSRVDNYMRFFEKYSKL